MSREDFAKNNHWKKYQGWKKDVAVKYEVLLDPEKDADIIQFIQSSSGAKSSLLKRIIRYYIKAHTKDSSDK